MSILLIGSRNRYFSHDKGHSTHSMNQAEEDERRSMQEKYRQQLLEQMQQKRDKKKRQRDREIELDLKHEKAFYDQLHLKEKQMEKQFKQEAEKYSSRDHKLNSHSMDTKSSTKEDSTIFPSIKRSYHRPSNDGRITPANEFSFDNLNDNYHQRQRRVKTEGAYDNSRVVYEAIDDRQYKQKLWKEELEQKISEVYQLMAKSIKTLHDSQQAPPIRNRIAPIKLNLNKGYRVRYPQNSRIQHEPSEASKFYQLPNISTKMPTYNYEGEQGWKEWYHKQKQRYRDHLESSHNPERRPSRLGTPVFRKSVRFSK